jgi:SAM-dependent methyltransferase
MSMTDWFESSLGQSLLAQEQLHCRNLVPSGYYPSSLQVGQPSISFLEEIESASRFYIGNGKPTVNGKRAGHEPQTPGQQVHCAISKSTAMPFADKTHNLIVLPHTLDFCDDPHAVLREVNQILVPEGCVVITGFNQLSLWGGVRLAMKGSKRAPWTGHYYRVGRVQDWLSLLGFDLVGANMMAYQPPLQNEKWRRKLEFIDKVGDRWWPGFGAVYIIVGRKKEIAVTARGAKQLRWRRLIPGIAQPAVQNAASVQLKLVRTKR